MTELYDWVAERVAADRAGREVLDRARSLSWRNRMRGMALRLLRLDRLGRELETVHEPEQVLEAVDRAAREVLE